jgi:hypothetical protein
MFAAGGVVFRAFCANLLFNHRDLFDLSLGLSCLSNRGQAPLSNQYFDVCSAELLCSFGGNQHNSIS